MSELNGNPINLEALSVIFDRLDSPVARDLKLSLRRVLEDSSLGGDERLFTLLATATSAGHGDLANFARTELFARGKSEDEVREATESVALMAMLNMYYRFRHMLGKEDDYKAARLRMNSMSKPVLGKERFEMLALAVSILNGCESCIRSHEKVLRDAGLEAEKIDELARIAASVKGLSVLNSIQVA
jgi:alkyl hydroperoxide reductase subunit D